MDIDWQDTAGIVVIGLLLVALVLDLAGIETVVGYDVFDAGQSAVGYLAAGNFSVGVLSAGIFSVGLFSAGIFSVGVFAIGIFSVGIFSFGLYAVGIYAAQQYIRSPQDSDDDSL
jgi:uncharacterized protein (DUF2235 family)